ncbi:protein DOWNY MILDEW RESISTANCE 6-like [Benincasa hispida]|uniref:protein DOWNY MILDEW RESISTANCE 6-like n=1 Tax=Benincasa hispida TaxID=102211 RepID=UPI00190282D4|nr:protein DOWNY MILDEW RESISTANCE 6-like [Benincasa hispida]
MMSNMSQMKVVSNWMDVESVPENYVFPSEKRPTVAVKTTISVLDLATDDRTFLFQNILDITRDLGFFQVINHGVSKELINKTMMVFKEFHAMSSEEKERECSKDPNKSCKFYTSSVNYETEQAHSWRDVSQFDCHPLEKYIHFWPEKPLNFREVVGEYCIEMRKLACKILEVISEGLGLGRDYFKSEMSEHSSLLVNHYPPCPNPSLTLGLFPHCDPNFITILFQDINGLQVFKNGQWIDVDPIDDALIVNFGYFLEIISNGNFKATEHRVMTNTKTYRQTLVYLVFPKNDATIEPAKNLINEVDPPQYRSINCKEFMGEYFYMPRDREVVIKYLTSTNLNESV